MPNEFRKICNQFKNKKFTANDFLVYFLNHKDEPKKNDFPSEDIQNNQMEVDDEEYDEVYEEGIDSSDKDIIDINKDDNEEKNKMEIEEEFKEEKPKKQGKKDQIFKNVQNEYIEQIKEIKENGIKKIAELNKSELFESFFKENTYPPPLYSTHLSIATEKSVAYKPKFNF